MGLALADAGADLLIADINTALLETTANSIRPNFSLLFFGLR